MGNKPTSAELEENVLKLGLLSPDKPMWLHHLAQFHGSNSHVIGSVVINNRLYSVSQR